MGTIGRHSGQVRLHVLQRTAKAEVQPQLLAHRQVGGTCYTDEHLAYSGLDQEGVSHKTVCHSAKEWARDDDGDGINEVHTNTMEGFWTGLRNFLRPFRGVSKHYLYQYVAMYQWIHNTKLISHQFVKAMTFTTQHT